MAPGNCQVLERLPSVHTCVTFFPTLQGLGVFQKWSPPGSAHEVILHLGVKLVLQLMGTSCVLNIKRKKFDSAFVILNLSVTF